MRTTTTTTTTFTLVYVCMCQFCFFEDYVSWFLSFFIPSLESGSDCYRIGSQIPTCRALLETRIVLRVIRSFIRRHRKNTPGSVHTYMWSPPFLLDAVQLLLLTTLFGGGPLLLLACLGPRMLCQRVSAEQSWRRSIFLRALFKLPQAHPCLNTFF